MDPVSRARARMLVHRIDQDWYSLLDEIEKSADKKAAKPKKMLRESLVSAIPVFSAKPYFLSDEFSLVDCTLAPLLWRLPMLGIDLPKQAEVIPVASVDTAPFLQQVFRPLKTLKVPSQTPKV